MEYVVGSIGTDGCLGRTLKTNSWERASKVFFYIASENSESIEQTIEKFDELFENGCEWTSKETNITYFVGALEDYENF